MKNFTPILLGILALAGYSLQNNAPVTTETPDTRIDAILAQAQATHELLTAPKEPDATNQLLVDVSDKIDTLLQKSSQWASVPVKPGILREVSLEEPSQSAAGDWGSSGGGGYQPSANINYDLLADKVADRVYRKLVDDNDLSGRVSNSIYEKLVKSGLFVKNNVTASAPSVSTNPSSPVSGYQLNPGERIISIDGVPVNEIGTGRSTYRYSSGDEFGGMVQCEGGTCQRVSADAMYYRPSYTSSRTVTRAAPMMAAPLRRMALGTRLFGGFSQCGPGGCN